MRGRTSSRISRRYRPLIVKKRRRENQTKKKKKKKRKMRSRLLLMKTSLLAKSPPRTLSRAASTLRLKSKLRAPLQTETKLGKPA